MQTQPSGNVNGATAAGKQFNAVWQQSRNGVRKRRLSTVTVGEAAERLLLCFTCCAAIKQPAANEGVTKT